MAINETHPDRDYDWHTPKEGDVMYIKGVLHQFQYAVGGLDWFMVPMDGKPDESGQTE